MSEEKEDTDVKFNIPLGNRALRRVTKSAITRAFFINPVPTPLGKIDNWHPEGAKTKGWTCTVQQKTYLALTSPDKKHLVLIPFTNVSSMWM